MSTAKTLKDLRLSANLTQKELADKLHIGQSTIVGYEQGRNEPVISILNLYADYFGVTVDELLGREPQHSDIIERPAYDLSDSQLVDLMKLYKVMTEIQKAHVLGYIIAYLEREGVNVKSVLNY